MSGWHDTSCLGTLWRRPALPRPIPATASSPRAALPHARPMLAESAVLVSEPPRRSLTRAQPHQWRRCSLDSRGAGKCSRARRRTSPRRAQRGARWRGTPPSPTSTRAAAAAPLRRGHPTPSPPSSGGAPSLLSSSSPRETRALLCPPVPRGGRHRLLAGLHYTQPLPWPQLSSGMQMPAAGPAPTETCVPWEHARRCLQQDPHRRPTSTEAGAMLCELLNQYSPYLPWAAHMQRKPPPPLDADAPLADRPPAVPAGQLRL